MSRIIRDRIKRQLDEAEGYLMLDLPERALEILERRADWATMQFEASFLTGRGPPRRSSDTARPSKPLEVAAALRPGDIGVAIALGWCYKRTHRLAQAIDALERAAPAQPRRAAAPLQPRLLLEPGRQRRQGPRRAGRRPWTSTPTSAT